MKESLVFAVASLVFPGIAYVILYMSNTTNSSGGFSFGIGILVLLGLMVISGMVAFIVGIRELLKGCNMQSIISIVIGALSGLVAPGVLVYIFYLIQTTKFHI